MAGSGWKTTVRELQKNSWEKLNHEPHYMMCDENVTGQRHGLGLLIVRQIAQVHGGTMQIGHSRYGGFEVIIDLPCRTETSEQRVSY